MKNKKLENKKLEEITVQDMMLTPMGCKIVADNFWRKNELFFEKCTSIFIKK